MDNVDVLPNHNIAEYREEREDSRERRFAVDDEERDVVDLEPIGKVTNSCPSFVCMCNDNHFMSPVYKFLEAIRTSCEAGKTERLRRTAGRCDFRFHLEESIY